MRALMFLAVGLLIGQSAMAQEPSRLITIGGAVTETVFALGAGNLIVGIDQTSSYPPEATASLPQVGYSRSLAAEGLLSLKADLLIAGPEAGPASALQQAETAGLQIVRLKGDFTPEGAMSRVLEIGKAISRNAEAEHLVAQMKSKLAQTNAELSRLTTKPKVLFLLQGGRGAPMAGGRNTAADAMISLAGGINVAGNISGYKPLSPEAVHEAAPDILIMMDQSIAALGGKEAVLSMQEIAGTPAAINKRLIAIDGNYMLGFGPRLAEAVHDLAMALHPSFASSSKAATQTTGLP